MLETLTSSHPQFIQCVSNHINFLPQTPPLTTGVQCSQKGYAMSNKVSCLDGGEGGGVFTFVWSYSGDINRWCNKINVYN